MATIVSRTIPAIVPVYNQLTYVRDMVRQLAVFTDNIWVVDNCSSYPPLLDYYRDVYRGNIIRKSTNRGHTVYTDEDVGQVAGPLFLLTDPDLLFNPDLPADFLEVLHAISDDFEAYKTGFALDIDGDFTNAKTGGRSITAWESQFWQERVIWTKQPDLPVFRARIDTTFCLINTRHRRFGRCLRVAGPYTARHRPWYRNWTAELLPGEYEAYLRDNRSTTWCRAIASTELGDASK